ncbi:hypothetical protein CSZ94_14280 [Janthinobacterium sp. ROICE36]|uniref:hypothetical protein n=1 Tax=Janthinobacterium sp. ROICE36 TaxID=2048670 RepID=UPI000C7F077C|nr:hypothetical protein [Janthinobacterium sp. ROICE36]PLY41675.1 hypothetical protein CSZ94_14280 [Janthinobacterium sp. ROICE36]
MSARDHDAADLREEMITCLTAEKYEAARTVVLTGSVGSSGIANLLLDKLAERGVMNVLARTALACDDATAGAAMREFVAGTIYEDAVAVATREIDSAARLARDDPANCQPKTRAQAVALEKLQV